MRSNIKILLAAVASLAIGNGLFAAESATGVVNLQSINGTGASQTFTYDVTITNNGTTNIESFWYEWLPPDNFYDFLRSMPSSEVSPTGWIATVEGSNSGTDDNSILWTTTTSPLTPGSSKQFIFTTKDNFSTVTGPAPAPYTFYPSGYSYVYTGAPENDPGALVNVLAGSSTPVPEPASLGMLAAGAGLLCLRRRRAAGN